MTKEQKKRLARHILIMSAFDLEVEVSGPDGKPVRGRISAIKHKRNEWKYNIKGIPATVSITDIKPVLRPKSSLTDEEWAEYECLGDSTRNGSVSRGTLAFSPQAWFILKNHIDAFGLIKEGLAVEK